MDHREQFGGRYGATNAILDLGEETSRLLDAGARLSPDVKTKFPSVHGGEEVLTEKGDQKERAEEQRRAGPDEPPSSVEQGRENARVCLL